MELKTIQTNRAAVRYYEGGSGRPLVFLHGAGGLDLDLGFLDGLSQRFHVYAPLVPGYGDSEECGELRDMLDFTLHTWDVVERLGLRDPILAGFSMGGMIASEMAAIAPNDVSRLALIAPAGLWLDEHPIADIFAMLPYELPGYLFYDAEAGAKIMSAGGKILFPIPERGLGSRLYRIKAKTLLIWGEGDKLIPPVYAQAFQRGIAGAEVVLIPQAGHVAPFEKPAEVIGAIARLQ